jgi:hypothetical protein
VCNNAAYQLAIGVPSPGRQRLAAPVPVGPALHEHSHSTSVPALQGFRSCCRARRPLPAATGQTLEARGDTMTLRYPVSRRQWRHGARRETTSEGMGRRRH